MLMVSFRFATGSTEIRPMLPRPLSLSASALSAANCAPSVMDHA
jgi:hypothetical protein